MGGNNKLKPNVIRGGRATNIKGNLYYMSGRKHETGGIDIGKNPRTGLEVEDGEVVQTSPNGLKVFSAQPILNGNSPAKLVMGGANPAKVFNAQERFKEVNGINDDGTKKKRMGGLSRSKDYGSNKKPYPSVNKKDFAGGGRSYPIPTRADAVDALRLAGLHGRSDVKAKVYKKYPDLKKKRMGGIREDYTTLAGEYYGREEAKTIKALRNARTNPQYQGRNLNLPTLSMNDAYGNLPVTPSNRTAIERTNAKYNTSATKPKTKRQSFNSAFAAARKQGLSEFTWNGKQYRTQLAGSTKPKTNQQTSTKSSITSNNLPEVTVTASRVNSRLINQLEANRYVPSKPKPIQEHTVKVESNTVSPVKRRSTINDKPGKIGYIDNNGDVIYGKSGSNEVGDILSTGFDDMIEYGRGVFNRKKKVGGRVVTVNGNVKSGLVISPSSTGEREKAAIGKDYDFRIDTTKYKIGDTFEYKGKQYKVTGRNAAKPIGKGTDREVRTAARRDAKSQTSNSRWIGGGNFNEVEPFTPTPSKSTGNSKPKESTNKYDYRIGNKTYKKGDTFEYKGQTYRVSGRNKAVPYNAPSSKPQTSSEVQAAAKRDAKGGRTDFRNMLEIPEFTPGSYSRQSTNNAPAAQTRVTPEETPVRETVQPTATRTSVPQTTNAAPRRRSTNRTSTTPTAAKPTATQQRTAPNFASLDSMMQGLPTASRAGIPDKLESPVAANQNVPNIISSPKKRLALFDGLDTSDIIGLGSNLAGTIASGINTRKALNNMEAPVEPRYETPAAMKTHFNISPQVGEITENTRRAMEDIDANTSSSRVALQRKQRARNAAQYSKNNLYGQKENIETQLINQDRLNRQRVGSRNTAAYNDWRNRTTQFRNAIREQKASSLNNMFSGINAGLQDMLSRIENRRNYNNTLGIYDATHPNTDKRLFRDKGVTI